jgi:LmbE family N-acetylglucosaminyl deacetylase
MAGRRILALSTHPDDVELTCGASIARWVAEGDAAFLIVGTDGSRGGKEGASVSDQTSRVRRQEQLEAAALMGIEDVVFLGLEDGAVEDSRELRALLVEQIRTFRPDVAIATDPTTLIYHDSYVNHRDHRMLGTAFLDALYPEASNAAYFPEQLANGLRVHKVPELLLYVTESPNYWVDVSETLDKRFEALRCHASQMQQWPQKGEELIEQQRRRAASIGAAQRMGFAEEFRRILADQLS